FDQLYSARCWFCSICRPHLTVSTMTLFYIACKNHTDSTDKSSTGLSPISVRACSTGPVPRPSLGELFIAVGCRLRIGAGFGPRTGTLHTVHRRVAAADKAPPAHVTFIR